MDGPALHPGGESASPAAAPSFSLLVVDDNELNRDALARRLRRRGYGVTTVPDGLQALAQVQQARYDLVLLDVMMPGLDGFEVLQQLRTTHSATVLPVIMATAKDQSDAIVRALELGANDYVTKPFDFPVVLARVQTQLAVHRSVQQILDLQECLRRRNDDLESANAQLQRAHERMRRDLQAAARVQEALLPSRAVDLPGLHFAWAFQPSAVLAGDALNICRLTDDAVGLYVLDVSGHGVAAALLSVAVTRALAPVADPESLLLRLDDTGTAQLVPPTEVGERLNQRFAWDPSTEQFFTLMYGIVQARAREFCYISAGHPPGIHLSKGRPPTLLPAAGLPIGLGDRYELHRVQLELGERLYFYSDGVTEALDAAGEPFGKDRLLETLEEAQARSLAESVTRLQEALGRWCGTAAPHDDISILAVEAA